MKRVLSIAELVTVLFLVVCGQAVLAEEEGKSREKIFGEPKEDSALVYFLREKSFVGGGGAAYVFSDSQLVTVVSNNSYNFVHMTPGKHILWWGRNFPGQEVEFEAGEVYFMDLTPVLKKRDRFPDEASANELLDKIEFRFVPTQQNKKKAEKFLKKNYAKVMKLPPEVAGQGRYCPSPEGLFAVPSTSAIEIRPVELQCDSPYPQEVTDNWAGEFQRLLAKQLKKQGFNRVESLDAEGDATGDVVIEGRIVQLKKGSGARRWVRGGGRGGGSAKDAVFMRVEFSLIERHGSGATVIIPCARTGYGSGMALLTVSSKKIMHNNIEKIAERLAEVIAEAEPGG